MLSWSTRFDTLLSQARKAAKNLGFDLGAAERSVVARVAAGEWAILGCGDPAHSARWGTERTIDARFLCWLVSADSARHLIPTSGIKIAGARIAGPLTLNGASIEARLGLKRCAIDRIELQDATTRTLALAGSRCEGIDAQRIHVRGALFLVTADKLPFASSAAVDLTDARIDGVLKATGAQIDGDRSWGALVLHGADIRGTTYLDQGFNANGKLLLEGARIGGSLRCSNARVSSSDNRAVEAEALRVTHSICLGPGFEAHGRVHLTDAHVGHNLDCVNGAFRSFGDVAIEASRIRIAGDVDFGGSRAAFVGAIVLSESKIGGHLRIADARGVPLIKLYRSHIAADMEVAGVTFAAGRSGVLANDARVDGELRWQRVTTAPGTELDLRGTRVATLDDRPQDWAGTDFKPRYYGLRYERLEHARKPEDVEKRLEWLLREPEFSPQPYDQLATALRSDGLEALAVKVCIAREEDRRDRGGLTGPARAWSKVLKVSIGSGYRPFSALMWAVAVLVFGSVVFGVAYADAPDMLPAAGRSGNPMFNPVLYSLDTLLPVVDLRQERLGAPEGASLMTRVARLYFPFHVLAGWILVTLGLLGVTGLVRKH